MKRTVFLNIAALLSALLMDNVAGPELFHQWVRFHFAAAVVALIGMKHGSWLGLAAGWFCAICLATITTEPVGLAMLTYGLTGFLSGYLREIGALEIPLLDAAMITGAVFLEEFFGSGLAYLILHVPLRISVWGIVITMICLQYFLILRNSSILHSRSIAA